LLDASRQEFEVRKATIGDIQAGADYDARRQAEAIKKELDEVTRMLCSLLRTLDDSVPIPPDVATWYRTMRCEKLSYMVPENPFCSFGPELSAQLNALPTIWDFGFGHPISTEDLCPLGRIEQAVGEGLAKLRLTVRIRCQGARRIAQRGVASQYAQTNIESRQP